MPAKPLVDLSEETQRKIIEDTGILNQFQPVQESNDLLDCIGISVPLMYLTDN